MGAEQIDILPGALDSSFRARVNEYVTSRQTSLLDRNLKKEKVIDQLGQDALAGRPWSAYMEIMDGIIGASAVLDPADSGDLTTLNVSFADKDKRDRFHDIYDQMLAGTHGPEMPHFRTNEPPDVGLTVRSFGYADACTAGRIGTALFRQQYKKSLGPGLRLILTSTIGDIERKGLTHRLPIELQQRIARQEQLFGKEVTGTMLLTSGHISVIGVAMRNALKDKKLAIQRAYGERPVIEERLILYSTETDVPISVASIGRIIVGQIRERIRDFKASFQKRDYTKAMQDLWGLLSGFGSTEGIGAIVRASATLAAAYGAALWGMAADKRTKRRIQKTLHQP